ncbi:unnamed protein product [Blepharisma stoltei]|uniref:Palmitoyltransferase n=1 Tax=Blepharisma stoltei TaxID=1481888 RepID=A0AAU9JCT9_9CILI|nr:unnamed protein product [Blepharisma stoltei]
MESVSEGLPKYSRISKLGIKYEKIANLHCFLFDKNGVPRYCIGPHWPFFVGLNSFFVILALLFIFVICPTVGDLDTFCGVIIFGFLIGSYTLAALVNPGICYNFSGDQEMEISNSLAAERYCERCEIVKNARTTHCDECGVCIDEYDHHCPWTSKCIGKNNLIFFYGFLIGLLCTFIFVIVTMSLKTRFEHK